MFGQPYRLVEGRVAFLRQGTLCLNLNLREMHLQAPMVMLVSPGTVAEIREFSSDCDFAMLAFPDALIEEYRREGLFQAYLQRRLCLCIPLCDADSGRMETLCSLLWEVLHDSPLSEEMVRDMVLLLFHQVECYRKRYLAVETQERSRREEVLSRFIDLVNEHAVTERKVAFYADRLCLTPHYLCTIIRKAGDLTVMDWINRAVVQEAKILLRHSDMQISQIADRLNFANASFFCKYFRRLTGMSPGEYQQSAHIQDNKPST